MSTIAELLAANRRYARDFAHRGVPALPARGVAVLTCMDARLQPDRFLGLALGDAHIIRNAGGRASDDAMRSLILSSRLLGTRTYVVIQHTDCGMMGLSNIDLQDALTDETGADASHLDFLPIADLEQSVREDVRRIRNNAFIPPDVDIAGCTYDVATGVVTPVTTA